MGDHKKEAADLGRILTAEADRLNGKAPLTDGDKFQIKILTRAFESAATNTEGEKLSSNQLRREFDRAMNGVGESAVMWKQPDNAPSLNSSQITKLENTTFGFLQKTM